MTESCVSSEKVNIKLLSYNIDGLNDSLEDLRERCMYQIGLIVSENPDVIHLQEVVPSIFPILVSAICKCGYQCSDYLSVTSSVFSLGNYFILSFVKSSMSNISFRRVAFSGKDDQSMQGREMLFTSFIFNGRKLLFINSHLESCGTAFQSKGSAARLAQLSTCLSSISSHFSKGAAFLAGDLNIRDSEASFTLIKFPTIVDMAEAYSKRSGRPKECTWVMPNKPSVKLRFDRCYFNAHPSFELESFAIIGNEEVLDESTQCGYNTPSDHYGIVITIKQSENESLKGDTSNDKLDTITAEVVDNEKSLSKVDKSKEDNKLKEDEDLGPRRKKLKSSKDNIIDLTID